MRSIFPVKYYSREGFVTLDDENLEAFNREYLERDAKFYSYDCRPPLTARLSPDLLVLQ